MTHALGLDVGLSGVRATVVRDDGVRAAAARRPYRRARMADGIAEHDPEEWLEGVAATGREALAAALPSGAAGGRAVAGRPPAATLPGMFNDVFPILVTPDLPRSLGFYRDLLEGEVEYQFPPEGDPGYVGMNIGGGHLGIGLSPDAEAGAGGQRFSLWVYADSCDEAVERLRGGGATVTEEPADQPWGERVARVLDPDGNEVIVGQKA